MEVRHKLHDRMGRPDTSFQDDDTDLETPYVVLDPLTPATNSISTEHEHISDSTMED